MAPYGGKRTMIRYPFAVATTLLAAVGCSSAPVEKQATQAAAIEGNDKAGVCTSLAERGTNFKFIQNPLKKIDEDEGGFDVLAAGPEGQEDVYSYRFLWQGCNRTSYTVKRYESASELPPFCEFAFNFAGDAGLASCVCTKDGESLTCR